MQDNLILVTISIIAEKMKFYTNWDQDTETVTLENSDNILTLQINQNCIIKK